MLDIFDASNLGRVWIVDNIKEDVHATKSNDRWGDGYSALENIIKCGRRALHNDGLNILSPDAIFENVENFEHHVDRKWNDSLERPGT